MSYFVCLEQSADGTDTIDTSDSILALFDRAIEYYSNFIIDEVTTRSQVEHNYFYIRVIHALETQRKSLSYIDQQLKSEWKVYSPKTKYRNENTELVDYSFTLVFKRKV